MAMISLIDLLSDVSVVQSVLVMEICRLPQCCNLYYASPTLYIPKFITYFLTIILIQSIPRSVMILTLAIGG